MSSPEPNNALSAESKALSRASSLESELFALGEEAVDLKPASPAHSALGSSPSDDQQRPCNSEPHIALMVEELRSHLPNDVCESITRVIDRVRHHLVERLEVAYERALEDARAEQPALLKRRAVRPGEHRRH